MDERRKIWNVVRVVQATTGFTLGLYLYIYGLFFFEKFGGDANPSAIEWTLILFVVGDAVILLLDVPTGILADYLGRKKTVLWSFLARSSFFLVMAIMCFLVGKEVSFVLSIVSYALFGVGYALFSGALVAWIVDCHRVGKITEGHGAIISRSYIYLFNAQLVGALLSFFLYVNNLIFFAFALGFISCVLCVVYCSFFMDETENMQFHHEGLELGEHVRAGLRKIQRAMKVYAKYPIIFYLSLLFALFMFLNHVVSYLWPVYMKTNFGFGKMSPFWVVVIILSIVMGTVGSKMLTRLIDRFKKEGKPAPNWLLRKWLVSSALLVCFPVLLLAIVSMTGAKSVLLLIATVVLTRWGLGFIRPCYETIVNNYIPAEHSEERATILSVGSMMVSVLVVLLMIPSGGSSGLNTVQGWILPTMLLLIAAVGFNVLIKRYQRRSGEAESAPVQTALAEPVVE